MYINKYMNKNEYIYTTQSLRVKWSDTTSLQFTVMNGVK